MPPNVAQNLAAYL